MLRSWQKSWGNAPAHASLHFSTLILIGNKSSTYHVILCPNRNNSTGYGCNNWSNRMPLVRERNKFLRGETVRYRCVKTRAVRLTKNFGQFCFYLSTKRCNRVYVKEPSFSVVYVSLLKALSCINLLRE